ncbi:hypothetical protein BC827DRAFT_1228704 [Russula dissimulans]|nr:hypothetical protein BC827DRAFT_1228704 [Russula dissimulans]
MRWTCLTLMALRPLLERSNDLHGLARRALFSLEKEGPNGRKQAQNFIENFDEARRCLDRLSELFQYGTTPSKEQVEMVLHSLEWEISELERINLEAEADRYSPQSVDWSLETSGLYWLFEKSLHGTITRQLPGVRFDDFGLPPETNQTVAVEWCKNYLEFPIIIPGQKLQSICSFASTFRNILQGDWDPAVYEETLKNLTEFVLAPP